MSHAFLIVSVDGSYSKSQLEEAVSEQMAPFDENGSCFKDGSRWDWWQIGGRFEGKFMGLNVTRKKDLDLDKLFAHRKQALEEAWKEIQEDLDRGSPPEIMEMIWGLKPGMTKEEYCTPKGKISAYAFLRNHHWHENERMGWFGSSVKTECEIGTGEQLEGKCLHKGEYEGKEVRVINWGASEDDWAQNFYKRFIEPLPAEDWLVAVDYHV